MKKDTVNNEHVSITSRDVLTEILRKGAQQMLATAIENEAVQYITDHKDLRDADGHRLVVRNGRLPARMIQTGVGPVEIQQPRVRDNRMDQDTSLPSDRLERALVLCSSCANALRILGFVGGAAPI